MERRDTIIGTSGMFKTDCNGDCAHCMASASGQAQLRQVTVLVTGSCPDDAPEPGRTLIHNRTRIDFKRADRPEDFKGISDDTVVLSIADACKLEQSLYDTAKLLDMDVKLIVGIGNYQKLLDTSHSLDYDTLSTLFGVHVQPLSFAEGKGVAALCDNIITAVRSRLTAKHIPLLRDATAEESRKAFVRGALQETLIHSSDNSDHTLLQKVDAILTNRWLGLPLLIIILLGIFEATFGLGAYPQRCIEDGIRLLSGCLHATMPEGWLTDMLVDGVVQGVGAVLAFLPNIIILFFFLSLLEDSGYMSRAAFLMDKIMHRIGLHGHSFVPMLIGFGCNVPAIMAAKSIANQRERTLTMLMIPFMSCSARLPVYMLFVSAFFAGHKALVMMAIYVTGILLSILFAIVMKRTRYFKMEEDDYVSGLPPFKKPSLSLTARHIWERVSDYLHKISTVILAASVIIWALEYFPAGKTDRGQNKEESYLATVGKALSPVMEPLGFDWKMNVCLITGLPAKEAIVSTMGILYHAEDAGNGQSLQAAVNGDGSFTTAVAISFMLFVLLYFPCVATVITLKKEVGWKWAAFTVIHSLLLAWVVAFAAFHILS